ncbi:MAG: glycoside hydrolase family 16 protein [Planctomycetaceae bacterium]|nr:glycoside hydrolase family 16 protein [Planctomycetaceae bacterium]
MNVYKTLTPMLLSTAILLCAASAIGQEAAKEEPPKPFPGGSGKFTKLVWFDEFDKDGLPDSTKWNYEKGYIRNRELQYYTVARKENAEVKDGNLIITARRDNAEIDGEVREITSASLTTRGKGDWQTGRIEVRAKVPPGLGTWPAIWMMPTQSKYGGWPRGGEIDIMEYVGYEPNKIHFFLHTSKYNHTRGTGRGTSITVDNPKPHENFHVYAVEWFEDRIDWFMDDKKVYTVLNNEPGWEAWPFDQDFYLILNFAFGGAWGATRGVNRDLLPLEYRIDYVRIFQ